MELQPVLPPKDPSKKVSSSCHRHMPGRAHPHPARRPGRALPLPVQRGHTDDLARGFGDQYRLAIACQQTQLTSVNGNIAGSQHEVGYVADVVIVRFGAS